MKNDRPPLAPGIGSDTVESEGAVIGPPVSAAPSSSLIDSIAQIQVAGPASPPLPATWFSTPRTTREGLAAFRAAVARAADALYITTNEERIAVSHYETELALLEQNEKLAAVLRLWNRGCGLCEYAEGICGEHRAQLEGRQKPHPGWWMQTCNRHEFDFTNPQPDSVHIADVAHALAHINRFAGHVGAYSVAEHSVRVASIIYNDGRKTDMPLDLLREAVLAGLLHDCAEAFTGDITTPVKYTFLSEDGRAHLKKVEHVVDVALDRPLGFEALVKNADLRMLATEARDLLGGTVRPWPVLDGVPAQEKKMRPWGDRLNTRAVEAIFENVHRFLINNPNPADMTSAPFALREPDQVVEWVL